MSFSSGAQLGRDGKHAWRRGFRGSTSSRKFPHPGQVAFDLRGLQVIITRADEASHEDPAIASFLTLLEYDIRTGQHLCNLPDGLVQAMQAAATLPVDPEADIEGDVAL